MPRDVEEILDRDRDAVEWAPVPAAAATRASAAKTS
jgi:hypothetical protein